MIADHAARLAAYEQAAQVRPWLPLYLAGGTRVPETGAMTVLDLVRAAPAAAPALIYFDTTLNYGTVDRLSDALAGWLTARGVSAGERVAVILQNVPQFVIAAVAVWKLSAIVVSLNPMYRQSELERLFADCRPQVVLCHDDHWTVVCAAARGLIDPARILWTSGREFQNRNDTHILPAPSRPDGGEALSGVLATASPPPTQLAPDDVGLLLYTSGTAGTPKGVMLTHRNLVHNALICRDHFALDQRSRIFGLAPLFHITGFEIQMVAAFAAGASVVLTYRFHPAVALEMFVAHRPSFIIGAVTAFIALMNHPDVTSAHFASFKQIYSGGAPIAPAVIEAFQQRFGRAIRSSYGMTELTGPSHFAPAQGPIPVDPESGALAIGIPTPGIDAIIVDDARHPLGPGQHGELAVRGVNVMVGYWGKPEETAEVLVDGWMHTGDVGFFDANGWFYLVDRKKDMISASGFKVWPREVEDVLYSFLGVREAAVVGMPDPYRGETVVAYVSAETGTTLDTAALLRLCRERLAAYKCPTRITLLPDLPKTASGKITRNRLKEAAKAAIKR